jgi:hypothetical protein
MDGWHRAMMRPRQSDNRHSGATRSVEPGIHNRGL